MELDVVYDMRTLYVVRLRQRLPRFAKPLLDAFFAGVHVVTGGLGGLGLRAAALFISCLASQVVTSSRSGRVANDGSAGRWHLLLIESSSFAVQAADVGEAAESRLSLNCRPCKLLHAAGTLSWRTLDALK